MPDDGDDWTLPVSPLPRVQHQHGCSGKSKPSKRSQEAKAKAGSKRASQKGKAKNKAKKSKAKNSPKEKKTKAKKFPKPKPKTVKPRASKARGKEKATRKLEAMPKPSKRTHGALEHRNIHNVSEKVLKAYDFVETLVDSALSMCPMSAGELWKEAWSLMGEVSISFSGLFQLRPLSICQFDV